MKKTKLMVVATLKVIEDVMQNGNEKNIATSYADNGATCYSLGENLFKSPIEFYHDKTKTMYGLLFYDTMDIKNWSMTLRQAHKGYFIHDGQWLKEDENGGGVVVPTAQVMRELREACEMFKGLDDIGKRVENGESLFGAKMEACIAKNKKAKENGTLDMNQHPQY